MSSANAEAAQTPAGSAIRTASWGRHAPSVWRFWRLIMLAYKRPLLTLLLTQTVAVLAQVLMPLTVSAIVADIMGSYRSGVADWSTVSIHALGFVFFALGDFWGSRASGINLSLHGPLFRHTVTLCLFEHAARHSHRYIINHQSGYLTSKISEAAGAVTQCISILLMDLWPAFVVICGSALMLAFVHPVLALAVLLWAIPFFAYAAYGARQVQPLAKTSATAKAKMMGSFNDLVANLLTVKLFARGDYEATRLQGVLEQQDREELVYSTQLEQSRVVLFFAANVFKVLLLLLAAYLVAGDGFGAAHFVLLAFLANVITNHAHTGTKRMTAFLGINATVQTAVSTLLTDYEVADAASTSVPAHIKGAIEFDQACLRYEAGRDALAGLSLHIAAGQRVGLVGSSGAGKSSFTNLLLRLYDTTSGTVRIDGHNIADLPLASLYEQIAVIPQDPVLFHRSIMENIRYGQVNASDEQVIAVAKCAACHDFIISLPDGYQSLVGERGVKLSGGQRQRIAIARALLKDAPIVIMDEATSALDSITEAEVLSAFSAALQGKTVIVVAHRLATIKDLDRILVFADGHVIEDGTHEQLLALNGQYARLWEHQCANGPSSSLSAPAP